MPIILSNESVAISNEVYQNKDIFADKKKLPHGYVNESRLSPVDTSPSKVTSKENRRNSLECCERNGHSPTNVCIFFLLTTEKISPKY